MKVFGIFKCCPKQSLFDSWKKLVLMAAMGFATHAQAHLTTKPTSITSLRTGKCVAVKGMLNGDGTPIVQLRCSTAANASWTLEPALDSFRVIAASSGKCLSIAGASTAEGAKAVQADCNDAAERLWKVEAFRGYFRIRAKHSNKCLNMPLASTANDVQLTQETCLDQADRSGQLWTMGDDFIPGYQSVQLVTNQSQLCLDSVGGRLAAGTPVQQSECRLAQDARSPSQAWHLRRALGGYQILGKQSQKCLGVVNGSLEETAQVELQDCNYAPRQLWTLRRTGPGFNLLNTSSKKCLDVKNGELREGAALVQLACGARPSQTWKVATSQLLGDWGPLIDVPLVPVSAANLPNGKVMLWTSRDEVSFGGDSGHTITGIFDPLTNRSISTNVTNTAHDMFCPGTSLLEDGRLLVAGGLSSTKTSIYDFRNNTWTAGDRMNAGRGYQANTVLADGKVFTIGGSFTGGVRNKDGEVWDQASGWTTRPNVSGGSLKAIAEPRGQFRWDNHAWLFAIGGGRVLHAGPSAVMHWYGTAGAGSTTVAGLRGTDAYSMNGSAVMYDIGKILKLGGAPSYDKGVGTARAYTININAGIQVTPTGNLTYPRSTGNSVVLPDGQVLTIGGQSLSQHFTDLNSIMTPEIWDPATGRFRTVAKMTVPRNYHSIALLLPDARVISGGGGLCGGCPTNHLNVQMYSPNYLFQANGSPAVRPVIQTAPAAMGYNQDIKITTNRKVATFSLVRLSAVTHTTNNDQRRIPLRIVTRNSDNIVTLRSPANGGVAIPGYYMLFAMDANGVPSIAKSVQVR